MKKCTVILTGRLRENGHLMPEFTECSERAELNSKQHGGEVIHKYMIRENLGDGQRQDFVFIVEYPRYEDVVAAHSNDEYQQIASIRKKVFSEFNVMIAQ